MARGHEPGRSMPGLGTAGKNLVHTYIRATTKWQWGILVYWGTGDYVTATCYWLVPPGSDATLGRRGFPLYYMFE